MKTTITLPCVRMLPTRIVEFPKIPNRWGTGVKIAIREAAKSLPLYRTPVEFPDGPVYGRSDNGDKIPIDTFGRWLFGTPGFAGQCRFDGFAPHLIVRVPDMDEAEALIRQAVERLVSDS